jgi:hypothetical protein
MVGVDLDLVHELVEQNPPFGLVGLVPDAIDVELTQEIGECFELRRQLVGFDNRAIAATGPTGWRPGGRWRRAP